MTLIDVEKSSWSKNGVMYDRYGGSDILIESGATAHKSDTIVQSNDHV